MIDDDDDESDQSFLGIFPIMPNYMLTTWPHETQQWMVFI